MIEISQNTAQAIRDLKMVTVGSQRQNVSDVSGNFQLPKIYALSNREAERRRKEQTIVANDYRLPHLNSINFFEIKRKI